MLIGILFSLLMGSALAALVNGAEGRGNRSFAWALVALAAFHLLNAACLR
jgi:hypothetical protein